METDFGENKGDSAYGVALQPDGKFVLAGSTYTGPPGTESNYALARFNANGTLDTTFSGDGITVTVGNPGHIYESAQAVAFQADGKILIAGGNSFSEMTVLRYLNDDEFPPDARADAVVTDDRTAVTIDVRANDSDWDGNLLTITGVTQGAKGGVAIIDGKIKYTPIRTSSGTDTFTYTVGDGTGRFDTATVTVAITKVPNKVPTLGDDVAAADDRNAILVGILVNDFDLDGDDLTIDSFTQGKKGSVIQVGSQLKFTPVRTSNGTDEFTYTVSDGWGGVATAKVTVNITAIPNAPPIANSDSATTNVHFPVTITVLGNDTDGDGDSLTLTDGFTQPTVGVVTKVGNQFKYVAKVGASGPDSFTYAVIDGWGGTATGTVTVDVIPNVPPVAAPDSAATDDRTAVTVTVLGNDTDADGDAISISGFTQPANGTVSKIGNQFKYTPTRTKGGPDTFTYTIKDGWGGTATGTVTVEVAEIPNQVPTAGNNSGTTTDKVPITLDVLANDTDGDGDSLAIQSFTQGMKGVVSQMGTKLKYTPDINADGLDLFTYTISDGWGGSATGSASINVIDVTAPVILEAKLYYSSGLAKFVPLSTLGAKVLPFANVKRFSLKFSEDMQIATDDLTLMGVRVNNYAMANFNYDAATRTATWTLAQAIDRDRVTLRLDGTGPDGMKDVHGVFWGSDTFKKFAVLVGDVNGDGRVTPSDLGLIVRQTVKPYNAQFDIDGDGDVDYADYAMARGRLNTKLP